MTQSQNTQILHYLKCGRHLTPIAALHLFGCFRLSARICELRKNGHRIERKSISINGKTFAEYHL